MLLHCPRVQVLALTSVTGDSWRDEGTANVLRFLEEIGRADVPVANGAVFPLINTAARLAAWEGRHAPLSWKGAWNSPRREKGAHPDTPFAIRLAREGAPRHRASAESAVSLMIRLVHEHPHEVTVISGGPMTNLALAVRQDWQFAVLARRLVLGDVRVHGALAGSSEGSAASFNVYFDPEAAHIVLTAGWPEIVCFDPLVDQDPMFDAALLARIQEHPTPASNFLAENTGLGTPLWAAPEAYVADPSLARAVQNVRARLDVCLNETSALFGSIVLAPPDQYAGPPGGTSFTIVTDFDWERGLSAYVAALQAAD
jgi:inosine-uridine nucleoside N-ribohydrolase